MSVTRRLKTLQVGFVPLIDAAPLIVAAELGLFKKHGLRVQLSREIGWATIRDKIIFGHLDAAHALAALPFVATLGQGCVACDCLTGLVLNRNGNAVTLSNQLRDLGVRDAASLRRVIELRRPDRRFTFGVVFSSSSHHHLLRLWLESGRVHPDADVNIVVVPAPSMFDNLRNGHLDGYCVGEPWNSLAARKGIGWSVATSLQLAPGHPEKVLMARRQFAEEHPEEYLRLIAAIYEGCVWCDQQENRETLARMLARRGYVNVPYEYLRECLAGPANDDSGSEEPAHPLHVFHRNEVNVPTPIKGAWVMNHLLRLGQPRPSTMSPALIAKVFRQDLFHAAVSLVDSDRPEPAAARPEIPFAIKTAIEPICC